MGILMDIPIVTFGTPVGFSELLALQVSDYSFHYCVAIYWLLLASIL